jgi:hypothetical protein
LGVNLLEQMLVDEGALLKAACHELIPLLRPPRLATAALSGTTTADDELL